MSCFVQTDLETIHQGEVSDHVEGFQPPVSAGPVVWIDCLQ